MNPTVPKANDAAGGQGARSLATRSIPGDRNPSVPSAGDVVFRG